MTGTSSPRLGALGQLSVATHDLPRATAFYRDTLGLTFLFEAPGMAFFDAGGGVRLMLAAPEGEADAGTSILYFRVEDIRATHGLLAAEGVSFLQEPRLIAPMPDHDLWMAFFRDSEGNTLALMAEEAKAG